MRTVIALGGKAKTVFALLAMLAKRNPGKTLKEMWPMKCELCGVTYQEGKVHDAIKCEERISRMLDENRDRRKELSDNWQVAIGRARAQKIEQQRNQEGLFSLRREDASHLGGPMGSEYTTTDWIRLFDSEGKAKQYAEADAGRQPEWKEGLTNSDIRYLTWDAGSHIYTINKEEVLTTVE